MMNGNQQGNSDDKAPPPPPPPPVPSSEPNTAGLRHRRAQSTMPHSGGTGSNNEQQQQQQQQAPPPPPPPPPRDDPFPNSPFGGSGAPRSAIPNSSGNNGLPPRHDRKVSWGGVTSPDLNMNSFAPSAVASALASFLPEQQQHQQQQQPQSSGAEPTTNNSNDNTNINSNPSFLEQLQNAQGPSTRRFRLNEVLGSGPVELEAETYILKAVEKLSGQRHERTATETASLFSDIAADEIARAMQETNNNEEETDGDDDQFDVEHKTSYSFGGGYVPQVSSQDDNIEVTAAVSSMRSMPSNDSNGTSNTTVSASSGEDQHPLQKAAAGGAAGLSTKSLMTGGKSTRTLSGGSGNNNAMLSKSTPSMRVITNMNGAKSTRSLGAGASGGAKSRLQSAIRKQMVQNNVEQTLFGLTSTLTQMRDAEEKKKEHRRQATQMNMAETDKLTETANALAGHLSNGPDSSRNDPVVTMTSDVEAPAKKAETPVHAESMDEDDDSSIGDSNHQASSSNQTKRKKKKKRKKHKNALSSNIKEDFQLLREFLTNQKWKMQVYIYRVIMFIMLPSIAIAALLYYFVENPTLCEEAVESGQSEGSNNNGTATDGVVLEVISTVCPGTGASVSWWIIFLGVRQVVTFTMALITQAFIVDYLALGSRFCLRYFGPLITLFLVQAKGWPFVAVFWAIYDLILLTGDHEYAHHWGYWQDWVELFNARNSSGSVVEHEMNYLVLKLAIFVGIAVAIKRLLMSLFLGRQTFAHYGEQLATVMKNMVLVGEVATLAKDIEYYAEQDMLDNASAYQDGNSVTGEWTPNDFQQLISKQVDAERQAQALQDSQTISNANAASAAKTFMANRSTPAKNTTAANTASGGPSFRSPPPSLGGTSAANEDFSVSEKNKLSELLDAWEEPQTAEQKEEKKITIGAVLQFRQALTFMQKRHPFLPAFGPADTRNRCVESSQLLYERLLLQTPDRLELPFETIALLTKDDNGRINQEKAKELIRVFRPDREGKITKLDFVKSIDAIYKSIRLLSANIRNSSQIDKAVENLTNMIFYIILGSFVLGQLGVNPLQLFFSLSSVILAFAFMFGNSSSKYFEGMLFILVQRPYGVGDRIHLSNPQCETSIDGSSGWVVEKVSLYTTSLYWGATNERATLANGAISNLRVINANRSPHAQIFVNMKFAIDTPYEKIVIFKAAIEQFLKDRPREWLAFVGFRPTEVAVERSFINFVTIAQHRSGWQDIGQILTSKAELVTYELEVAKQLQMSYSCPPLPVDLTMKGASASEMTPEALKGMAAWAS